MRGFSLAHHQRNERWRRSINICVFDLRPSWAWCGSCNFCCSWKCLNKCELASPPNFCRLRFKTLGSRKNIEKLQLNKVFLLFLFIIPICWFFFLMFFCFKIRFLKVGVRGPLKTLCFQVSLILCPSQNILLTHWKRFGHC